MIDKVRTRFWDVASCTYRQLLEEMEAWRRSGARGKYTCFCDAMGLAKGWRFGELRRAYRRADVVLADGEATKVLAKISGGELPCRVIGPYLFPDAMEYGVKLGWRHYFYGTNKETLDKLKANMEAKYPGVKIVGTYAPEYSPDPKPPADLPECDFFWVGLGNPKQEIWCMNHAKEINAVACLPVGAVFDFYSGTVPHAPDWVHKVGCRWLWRLLTGGKKTFRRNTWCVPRAAFILFTEYIRIHILHRRVSSLSVSANGMKVSVVTPCRNAVGTICDAMASVARQWGVAVEYIVVDGGSTDGTVEAIKKFAEETKNAEGFTFKWVSEKDRGLYDAINKGIGMATGDVVGICNADDILAEDDVLARVATAFGDSLDCVYGKVRFVKAKTPSAVSGGSLLAEGERNVEKLRKSRAWRRCFARLWRPWMLSWGYMPPHPGVFIRRECFERWGGYVMDRDEYRIAADYELLIRFFRVHKMRAKYSGVCTHVMRTGGVSTKDMNARRVLNAEIVKANRTNGFACCFAMLLPKYAVKIWEYIFPRIGLDGR